MRKPRIHFNLREWSATLTLQQRLHIALITGALLVGGIIAIASHLMVRHQIISNATGQLAAKALLNRRDIESRVAVVAGEAAAMATNPVTSNALADSLGRDLYLKPLLRNYALSWPGAALIITDHLGKPIAQSANRVMHPSGAQAISDMLQTKKAGARIDTNRADAPVVSIAYPIVYRLTDSVEGAVLLQFSLDLLENADTAYFWGLYDASGQRLIGSAPPPDALEVRERLVLPGALANAGLTYSLAIDKGRALAALDYLVAFYLGTGAIALLLVIKLASIAANSIVKPLQEFIGIAEEITISGRPSATIKGIIDPDFKRLSRTFNIMVDRLSQSYHALEERVAARTRDLADSEERWHLAVDASNDGIWDWSIVSGALFVSARARVILDCTSHGSPTAPTLNDIWARVHPNDRARVFETVGRHLRGETEYYISEHRIVTSDGSIKWVSDHGRATFDGDRTPQRLLVANSDMTERRNAEDAVRERTEQLNAVLSVSPVAFVSFDASRRVRYASPGFQDLTGLEPAGVVGLDEASFTALLAERCLKNAPYAGLQSLRNVGSHGVADPRGRMELALPVHRVIEFGVRTGALPDNAEVMYMRDITREADIDRMKSEFISTAAHELRTPMASIFGFSDLLVTQEFDPATQRDLLETINRNANLMALIIKDLLDLARIEARRDKDFIFRQLGWPEVARQIVADFKVPAGRGPVQFDMPAQPILIRGDQAKLTQALGNILSNAYKYSPGGGDVAIRMTLSDDGNEAGLRVLDGGIGMKADEVERVFERFFRADHSGNIPGTGLGMSIVKEIISLHNGRIELSSEPGRGTAVTIWLPILAAQEHSAAATGTTDTTDTTGTTGTTDTTGAEAA